MSQAAMSSGATGCPSLGPCANTGNAKTMIVPAARCLRIDIADLAFLVDAPTRNGVIVIDAAEPALGGELSPRGLHHAAVVRGATLQDGGTTVPLPGRAEPHRSFR